MKVFPPAPWRWLALFLGAALLLESLALASHFRYGNLSWAPTANSGEVEFRLILALRRDAIDYGVFTNGIDPFAETGDIISENLGDIFFRFGDATPTTPTLKLVVTAFSISENWLIAEALHPGTSNRGIRHTYANAGPFLAGLNDCCRIGTNELNNRANTNFILRAEVRPFSGNRSPVSTLVPIINLPVGDSVSFTVPAIDPDDDPLRFRLATDAEAGACCAPPGFRIDPGSGTVTWNNLGLDTNRFWTTQIVIEDLGASGVAKSKIPVDFLLRIVSASNTPPACMITPPGPFTVKAGIPLTFTVTGTDPDADDEIILNTGGLPRGATMTPLLPAVAPAAAGVSSDFHWVPESDQGGSYPVLFTVSDRAGSQARCDVRITVQSVSDLALSKSALPATLSVTGTVTYALNVANLGPSDASGVVVTDALPGGLNDVTIVPSQGSCGYSGGVVVCTLGALAAGRNAVVTVRGSPGIKGVLRNSASVSSSSLDLVTANNSATASILVTNLPPTVSIIRPADGARFSVGGEVLVEASVFDHDGIVTRVDFYADGTFIGVTTNAPFVVRWTSQLPGDFVLTAVATDDDGAQGTSAPVTIHFGVCNPNLNVLPLVNQTRCVCDEVQFTAVVEGSDPADFVWRFNDAVLPGQISASLRLHSLHPSQAGTYTVEVSTLCTSVTRSATLTLYGGGNLNPVAFSNASPITIRDANSALLYPSPIVVRCIPGPVKHLAVTLDGLSHFFPDDVDILLVGPTGAAAKLMSDAGGSQKLTNVVLTLSDTAQQALPDATRIFPGTYLPTDYGPTDLDSFPAPAQGAGAGASFAPFYGSDPNGTWSLFVVDDDSGDAGSVVRGWSLSVEWEDTRPQLTAPLLLADGRFQTTLHGLPRMTHVIEASADLSAWVPVSTNTFTGPLLLLLDPGPPEYAHRFFRAVRCP